jgi:hypothetical protein
MHYLWQNLNKTIIANILFIDDDYHLITWNTSYSITLNLFPLVAPQKAA